MRQRAQVQKVLSEQRAAERCVLVRRPQQRAGKTECVLPREPSSRTSTGRRWKFFGGDWISEEPDEKLKQVMDSEQASLAYHSWLAFDFDLGEGRTVFDLFLEREAKKLSSGECNFLDGMRGSHLRLYEILEVKTDQGFDLRDLWDDRRLWVRERLATQELATWDVIAGRLGRGAGGEVVFETIPHVYPATAKDGLLKGLRKSHRLFTREFPERSLADFFRSMAPMFHQLWLEQVVLRPMPKIVTADGDSFIFAKVIFDLLDRGALTAALMDHPDVVDHGDGSYTWLERRRRFPAQPRNPFPGGSASRIRDYFPAAGGARKRIPSAPSRRCC